MTVIELQPHAVLDLQSRRWKAEKIERLLELDNRPGQLRLLEVGVGSGGISHYFGTHPSRRFDVDAVDVHDLRMVVDGYRYTRVDGTTLPFANASFDVVISNHVIEHVGDDAAQAHHLAELHRVLRPHGIGYLAVPNRWMLVEPHYRLAFLSWWPEAWRTGWLRLWGKGDRYDCRPFSRAQLEARLARAGFRYQQLHGRALRVTFEIERPDDLAYRLLFRYIPEPIYASIRGSFPTLIYKLFHDEQEAAVR